MDEIPALVAHLAGQVKGNPIAWRITDQSVIIVMEDGRKLTFDRMPEPPEVGTDAPAESVAQVSKKSKRKEK